MTSQTTVSPQQLRGVAIMASVVGTFAAFWAIGGTMALGGVWRWIAGLVVSIITLVCYFTAVSLRRSAQQQPEGDSPAGTSPMAHPRFRLAVIFESVATPIVSILLARTGHADMIFPAMAIIVGLHFFVLVPAFQSQFFAWVGGAMILLALISLLLAAWEAACRLLALPPYFLPPPSAVVARRCRPRAPPRRSSRDRRPAGT